MKSILSLALLICANTPARAIERVAPGDPAYREIETELTEAKGIEEELVSENTKLQNPRTSPNDIATISAKIRKLEKERQSAYNKAIWITIQAYGILAPDQSLPEKIMLRKGPKNGDRVTWTPIFSDYSDRNIIDENGRVVGSTAFKDSNGAFRGVTVPDGTSLIFPDAFANPAVLCSSIIHEHTHFDQFTTQGQVDVLTHSELEMQAFQKEQKLLSTLVFPSEDAKNEQVHWLNFAVDHWTAEFHNDQEKLARGEKLEQRDVEPRSKAELARIQGEANALRVQVRKEIAIGTFQNMAGQLCLNPPGAIDNTLGSRENDYREACGAFPDKPSAHAWPDPTRGGMGVCGSQVTEILSRCEDPDQIRADIDAAVRGGQPVPQPPVLTPPAPAPDSSQLDQLMREARQREADKSILTNDYQGMATIAEDICQDPDDLPNQQASYCAYEEQKDQILSKYGQPGQVPPASWSDVNYSGCAGELLGFIENPFTNLCGATDLSTIMGKIHAINQKYHPAPNNPPSNIPRPRPTPTPHDPTPACPPGCTCTGPNRGGCPVP